MNQLQEAANAFASVISKTEDADELWHAMQWTEVLSLGNLLLHAGHVDLSQEVIGWWLRANGATEGSPDKSQPTD